MNNVNALSDCIQTLLAALQMNAGMARGESDGNEIKRFDYSPGTLNTGLFYCILFYVCVGMWECENEEINSVMTLNGL